MTGFLNKHHERFISVLCVRPGSHYYSFPLLDLWDSYRDVYNFSGNLPIIAHPPCQQWSKLKSFAKNHDQSKNIGPLCIDIVHKNTGIIEQPHGSELFRYCGIPAKKLLSVNLHWWGYPAQKKTLLYFYGIEPLAMPLNFNAIESKVTDLNKVLRLSTPPEMCKYLIDSILLTKYNVLL